MEEKKIRLAENVPKITAYEISSEFTIIILLMFYCKSVYLYIKLPSNKKSSLIIW